MGNLLTNQQFRNSGGGNPRSLRDRLKWRIGRLGACMRQAAHALVALRLETRARPSSVPDEDSMQRLAAVFKNKAPLACASGALFLNTGGGGVYRITS